MDRHALPGERQTAFAAVVQIGERRRVQRGVQQRRMHPEPRTGDPPPPAAPPPRTPRHPAPPRRPQPPEHRPVPYPGRRQPRIEPARSTGAAPAGGHSRDVRDSDPAAQRAGQHPGGVPATASVASSGRGSNLHPAAAPVRADPDPHLHLHAAARPGSTSGTSRQAPPPLRSPPRPRPAPPAPRTPSPAQHRPGHHMVSQPRLLAPTAARSAAPRHRPASSTAAPSSGCPPPPAPAPPHPAPPGPA